jgi:superfamily II DNA/RNA helicase
MGQYIDPSKFIKLAKPVETDEYVAKHKFSDFNVEQLIKNNIAQKGYITPSPIQDQTIPSAIEGRDVIGIASTGTGKTAAFAIPFADKMIKNKSSRVLIIAPTRELAQQIEDEFRSIIKGSGLYGALLIGGTPMGPQLRDLSTNPNIVIGTPGRIKDHIERRTLKIGQFNLVVLDEVDRMLDMGFIDDVREILKGLATPRQSLFFSATMDQKVRSLIETFSTNPIMVSLKTNQASENVNQDVVRFVGDSDRIDKLHDILTSPVVEKSIIFSETQRSTEKLSKMLIERGFKADAIHGGKTQGQRQRALNRFKKNEIKILVATDVAARGIDVVDISHVINFSQPQTYEDYIHRIGRAGRAGRIGYALTFVNSK